MQLVIDRFGRVSIPKAARKYLGVDAGSKLELELREGELILTPAKPPKGRLVREGRFLVWDSEAEPVEVDVEAILEQTREERHRRILE